MVELGTSIKSKQRVPEYSLAAFIKARTFTGAAEWRV